MPLAGDRGSGTEAAAGRVLIHGGTVWTPDGPRHASILVEGGRLAAIGESVVGGDGVERLDATGAQVVPGFIDIHVHVADRIGRFELADDFASGTEVAVRNGITTLFTFATQRSGESLAATVERYRRRAAGRCHCNAGLHLTPTLWPWDWHEVERLAARGTSTVKLYTTYREAGLHTDWKRLEVVMRRLGELGVRLLLHCEDDGTLAAAGATARGVADPYSHAMARPQAAEIEAIRRAVELAERTGCRLHVVHVSTEAGAALIGAARRRGAAVSCETCPQYLLLSDERLRGAAGRRFLCTPPLRDEATRVRLEGLAASGAFDLLATDHCAFLRADKDGWSADYRDVPNGLPGLGALVPLAYELFVRRHTLPLGELVRRLAENPARAVNLYPRKGALVAGADADLVVLDEHGPARRVAATLADVHDPWSDRATNLAVRHVLLAGRRVVRDGVLLAPETPRGALLSAF